MAVDLMKATAALNAYPWTIGALACSEDGMPHYCAIGLLLRYAGVPFKKMMLRDFTLEDSIDVAAVLRSEYGFDGDLEAIMVANDTAQTRDEAIDRVLRVLSGELTAVRHLPAPEVSSEATVWDEPDEGAVPAVL